MRYPVDDFKTKWYDAQPFGSKTTYGYHEGADLNLKTGGDSDLGQPLYAISDGEVTSVHNHTGANNFGNHIHIKHGDIWCHYAHCQDILVKLGDQVKEGQLVAHLGKSGTNFSHLHWAIKLQPTGIDAIARNTEELKAWTDPIKYVEKIISSTPIPPPPANVDDGSQKWEKVAKYLSIDVNAPYQQAIDKYKEAEADRTAKSKTIKTMQDQIDSLNKKIEGLQIQAQADITNLKADNQVKLDKAKSEWAIDLQRVKEDYEKKLLEEPKPETIAIETPLIIRFKDKTWADKWAGILEIIASR